MRVQSFRATLGRNCPLLAFFLPLYFLSKPLEFELSHLFQCPLPLSFALWLQRMRLFRDVQSSVVDQHGCYVIGRAARKHSQIIVNQDWCSGYPCTTSTDCKTEGELTVQMEGKGIGISVQWSSLFCLFCISPVRRRLYLHRYLFLVSPWTRSSCFISVGRGMATPRPRGRRAGEL